MIFIKNLVIIKQLIINKNKLQSMTIKLNVIFESVDKPTPIELQITTHEDNTISYKIADDINALKEGYNQKFSDFHKNIDYSIPTTSLKDVISTFIAQNGLENFSDIKLTEKGKQIPSYGIINKKNISPESVENFLNKLERMFEIDPSTDISKLSLKFVGPDGKLNFRGG